MKIIGWIVGIVAVGALIFFLLPIIFTVIAWIISVVATGYILWQAIFFACGPFDCSSDKDED